MRACPCAGRRAIELPGWVTDRLLMIYNADGGLVNGALDLLHKSFSPQTYACRLCEVTYGLFGMKDDWRATVAALPLPVEFLHRDEWLALWPGDGRALPVILRETANGMETVVSAQDFAGIESLEALQSMLGERLLPSLDRDHL